MTDSEFPSLVAVANYLAARREAILNNWRTACQADPAIITVAGMGREEFNDKAPLMLNELDNRMRQQPPELDVKLLANEHGLHRWQQGYSLAELLAEVQHLNQLLLDELRLYWLEYPTADMLPVTQAYELIAWFNTQSINGSMEQYAELQRISASNRSEILQKALDELGKLSQQRGDLLRSSTHDLRGGLGVVQVAASMLEMKDLSEEERKQLMEMLLRNLISVRSLVVQLMDLARLEAGQEIVSFKSCTVGKLLFSLLESYQPIADEKGLLLKADGPGELVVETDPVQLQRIVQNLVLNALKHTHEGWVSVSWTNEDSYRWTLSIQDSGPGLPDQEPGSQAQVLSPSAFTSAGFGVDLPQENARQETKIKAPKGLSSKGEGIGLSIVKHLCELLRASLEIETKPGQGTLFRIRMPIHLSK